MANNKVLSFFRQSTEEVSGCHLPGRLDKYMGLNCIVVDPETASVGFPAGPACIVREPLPRVSARDGVLSDSARVSFLHMCSPLFTEESSSLGSKLGGLFLVAGTSRERWEAIWVLVKIKPPGDRRFWSTFLFTWVPCWAPIFDPPPFVSFYTGPKPLRPKKAPSFGWGLGGDGQTTPVLRFGVGCGDELEGF